MAQLITGNGGYSATIGGTVRVFGSNDVDVISLADIAGKISFDGSFNRGDDFIILPNAAKTYSIVRASSSVILSDADNTITIPVGSKGTTLQFADGELVLKFDGQVLLGNQAVTTTTAAIAAALAAKTALPNATSASGTLLMAADEPVTVGGNVRVFGTNGSDAVTVADVAGNISFDGSFNRGGDKIVLSKLAEYYTAFKPNASNVVISDSDTKLNIPLGGNGLDIHFSAGSRTLMYNNNSTYLGNQVITASPAAINNILKATKVTKVASVPLEMGQAGMGEAFAKIDIDGDGREEFIFFPATAREPTVLFKDILSINIDITENKYKISVEKIKDQNGNFIKSEWVQDTAIADFNKDGLLDLLFAGHGSEPPNVLDQKGEQINLLITRKDGGVSYLNVNKFFVSAGFWHSTSIGDINGDKILDIAVVRLGQPDPALDHNGAFFLIGVGNGTFSLGSVPTSMTPYVNVGALVDVNNDGLSDYFWGNMWDAAGDKSNPRINRVYINQNGAFSEDYISVPFPKFSEDRNPYNVATDKIAVADFNNDGLQDLLIMFADYVNDDGRWLQLLKNKGNGEFEEVSYFKEYFSDKRSDSFEFFDFNKDGLLDIYQTIQFGGDQSDFRSVFDYIFLNMGDDKFEKYTDIFSIDSVDFDKQIHSSYLRFINLEGKIFAIETSTFDWFSSDNYSSAMNLYLIS